MKLLQGFYSETAAHELQKRMEDAGIAIVVTHPVPVSSDSIYSMRTAMFSHLVFAALPSQHADAMQLLRQPDHVVKHPVDVSNFKAHMQDPGKRQLAGYSLSKGLWLGVATLAGLVAVLGWALLQG